MPDIAIAAKRYDGVGTPGVFTGCIPLKPGQVYETTNGLQPTTHGGTGTPLVAQSSITSMSLWNGSTELRAHFSALYPQHPDGSVKSLMVSTELTLANETELPLILRLGTPTTLVLLPATQPVIDRTWMKFPRLIGCTDATHMCASRVALGPLVRVDDARLPAQWQNLLTYEFDSAPTMRVGAGTQGYPSYSDVLTTLTTYGNLGSVLCRLTHGSAVVTVINEQGGWPTPTSALTAQLSVGDKVETTGLSGQPFPIPPGSTITAIDGNGTDFTVSVTVDLTLSIFTPQLGSLPRTNGQQVEFEVTFSDYDIPLGEQANYNAIAPLYLRYMTATSGHLDKLRMAHLMACTREHDGFSWVGRGNQHTHGVINKGNGTDAFAPVRYHGPTYTDENGVAHPHNQMFPIDEYGQPMNLSVTGNQASSSGWKESAWMCYMLSGWKQPMGAIISYSIQSYGTTPGGAFTYLPFKNYPWALDTDGTPTAPPTNSIGAYSAAHTPSLAGGWDGPRVNWRMYRQGDLFLFMLSLPFDLNSNDGGHVAVSPRNPTNRAKYLVYFQRFYWDSVARWSSGVGTDAYSAPAAYPLLGAQFLTGLWGFSRFYQQFKPEEPDYVRVYGPGPNFQLQLCFNTLAQCYMHVKEDDFQRFQTKLGELALWLANVQNVVTGVEQKQLISGNPNAPVGHGYVYYLPYRSTHPDLLATPPTNPDTGNPEYFNRHPWITGMVTGLLTWAAMVTGNAKLLLMADGHATIYSYGFAGGNNVVPATNYALKYLGEFWHHLHYAAAWRAGEQWGIVSATAGGSPQSLTLSQVTESDIVQDITPQGGVAVANFTFNIAKGRVNEFHNRVKAGDPSTSRLLWVALATTGIEADATLKDHNTLAALLAGTSAEVTNTGYARIVVAAASLAALSPDDTNDRMDVDIPDPTWAAVSSGDVWSDLVLCYDPNNAATDDNNTIPLVLFDFSITPNGGPITGIVNAAGYHRAQQG